MLWKRNVRKSALALIAVIGMAGLLIAQQA